MRQPNTCQSALLSEVSAEISYGHTASATTSDVGPHFLRITDIQNNSVDWSSVPFCECSDGDRRKYELKAGDIVFARTGATTGKSFLIRHCPEGAVFASYLIRVRPSSDVEPRFLAHFFYTPDYWGQISVNADGTAQAGVNATKLKGLQVPLPPLPEQRRIADILDKADAIRRKRREALELADEFLRSAFLDMFGDPATNPKRWPVADLGEVATFIGGGTPSRRVPKYFTGDICWATSKDMKGEYLLDTEEHITREAIENSATKLVEPSCLLVVVKSKVLMHRLPVLLTMVPACFGQDLKAIIPSPQIPARYLARHMRVGSRVLLHKARGVNTEGLTLDHLRSYEVMLPPESEMERFADLEQRAQDLVSRSRAAADESDTLFDSLVQRAFRGEL